MEPTATVAASGAFSLQRYALLTRRTFEDTLLRAFRGAVRRVIAITPPFYGGEPASQAKARGSSAIERDLGIVFSPVRLKGLRHERIGGAAMRDLHLTHLRRKRPGAPMRRYGGPYFVDQRKFNTLATTLRSHVGRLAAGWVPAADAVKVATPAWVSRHGAARGSVDIDVSSHTLSAEAINFASRHAPVEELKRRIPYAVGYQYAAMQRELDHLLLRDATKAGLEVS